MCGSHSECGDDYFRVTHKETSIIGPGKIPSKGTCFIKVSNYESHSDSLRFQNTTAEDVDVEVYQTYTNPKYEYLGPFWKSDFSLGSYSSIFLLILPNSEKDGYFQTFSQSNMCPRRGLSAGVIVAIGLGCSLIVLLSVCGIFC